MEPVSVDWSNTKEALSKLISLFICEKCGNTLQEPCSFQMCDHYFCKSCSMNLINSGTNCPGCDAVLWREHLQPNLRISEAMRICQRIEHLVKDKNGIEETNNDTDDTNTYVFHSSLKETVSLNRVSDDDDEMEDLFIMEVEDDTEDMENNENELHASSSNSNLQVLQDSNPLPESMVDDEDDIDQLSDDVDAESISCSNPCSEIEQDQDDTTDVVKTIGVRSGALLALGKGKLLNVKQDVEQEKITDIDYNIDNQKEINCQDDETVLHEITNKGRMKTNSSDKMTKTVQSSPSPQKSQFSEAVSDEQCAQGVQRNPKRLTKKPKFTYGRKKKYGSMEKPVIEKSDMPLLVTARSSSEIDNQSIFEFCSGQITKPISFGKIDDITEKENENILNEKPAVESTSTTNSVSMDPSIFDFCSGTITKPISFKNNVDTSIQAKKLAVKTGSGKTKEKGSGKSKEKGGGKSKEKGSGKSKDIPRKSDLKADKKTIATKTEINDSTNKKVQNSKVRNLEKKNRKGETALHTACIKGNFDRAKELLELGAQANTKDFNGWTPLHEASNHGFVNIVELLLDNNAIIDCVGGEDNDTPLHDAVSNNRVEVTKLLLQRGAPTNIKNRVGLYPEGYAYTNEMKAVFREMTMFETLEASNLFNVSSAALGTPHVILSTNIKASDCVEIKKCCDRLGGEVVSEFDSSVTHVICGTEENGIAYSRTMKYLLGVLTGKWLVSFEWIRNSLKLDRWDSEAPYEVKGIPGASEGIPQKSRLNSFKCLPKLFEGCSFYLSGVFKDQLSKENVMNLITLGGGKMLYREPKTSNVDPLIVPLPQEMGRLKLTSKLTIPDVIFHAKENSAQVCCKEYIVYDAQENPLHKKICSPVLCTAPTAWLLDCISNFQILDIQDAYDFHEVYTTSQN